MKWIQWLFSLQFDILNKHGFFTARWAWPCLFYSLTPLFRLFCNLIVCKSRYVFLTATVLCAKTVRITQVSNCGVYSGPANWVSFVLIISNRRGVLSGQHCKSCGSQRKIVPVCGLYVFQLHGCTSVTPGNHEL